MNSTRRTRLVAAVTLSVLALAGCSPASDGSSQSEGTTVTVRLWDEQVADAYDASFEQFHELNPDIDVEVQLVPWADYWTKLPVDLASGDMADIFWTNSANFAEYVDNGNLINVSETIGEGDGDWVQSVVDLYTRDGSVWGVPQLWDSIALFYNKGLVEEAGIDPTSLRWDPSGENDSFLQAALRLTVDANGVSADQPGFDSSNIDQYAFNAQYDLQAILADFVGSNGSAWREGDEYVFGDPEGVEALGYVAALINEHHVSPSAADTSNNGNLARDMFASGKMALFQSGPYSLRPIADNTDIEWGIVPMLEGPAGRVSLVHGIVAVGNAATPHEEATLKVLEWLGSQEGQIPVAEQGAAFPGVISAQQVFVDYWADQGIDVEPFIDASNGLTTNTGAGLAVAAANQAMGPFLSEMMIGRMDPEEAVLKAEEAANSAVRESSD